MDELSDAIAAGKAKIEELTREIEQKTQEIAELHKELEEATAMRRSEHANWQVSDKEDKAAKEVVLQAKEVLANFYSENGLMLAQTRKAGREPFVSQAGEAPPPPPPTWEAPYGGKTEEQQGVQSVLEMIADDIQKDLEKAKAEEDAAEALYQDTKADIERQVANLQSAIVEMEGVRGSDAAGGRGRHRRSLGQGPGARVGHAPDQGCRARLRLLQHQLPAARAEPPDRG
eukprot:SRR837773.12961.p2 GENE.SRR837773.12961~~SRR837773.12961.p2  ORF type:complete len:242 (+),score=91.14 SRR837773.12961:39-728(+)